MTRKNLKLCSIAGCDQPLTARGWCHFHYYRWKRWGDPEVQGRLSLCAQCDSKWLYTAKGSQPPSLCPPCQRRFGCCQMCKEILPLEEFYKDIRRPHGVGGRCKRCSSRYSKLRNTAPRTAEQAERNRLKTRYGITPEQKQEMFEAQGGRCAICGQSEKLVVDHCHRKGSVRKLLCSGCNKGLGCFQDDLELLIKAVRYLTEHEAALERVT